MDPEAGLEQWRRHDAGCECDGHDGAAGGRLKPGHHHSCVVALHHNQQHSRGLLPPGRADPGHHGLDFAARLRATQPSPSCPSRAPR
eukprot:1181486-Prymnesium_polylepis.1